MTTTTTAPADNATVELVVADMAGTTIADDGLVMTVFDKVFDRLGARVGGIDRDQARAYALDTMGRSKIAVFRELLGDADLATTAHDWFEKLYVEHIDTEPPTEIPGALATLRSLRSAGVRICLVTGFSAIVQQALLQRLNWAEACDLALAPGGELRGRPFPDLILTAALRLGVGDMRNVAVVGDTANDLWSGTRAGVGHVVGVLTGAHDHPTLAAVPHTRIVPSFATLTDFVTT